MSPRSSTYRSVHGSRYLRNDLCSRERRFALLVDVAQEPDPLNDLRQVLGSGSRIFLIVHRSGSDTRKAEIESANAGEQRADREHLRHPMVLGVTRYTQPLNVAVLSIVVVVRLKLGFDPTPLTCGRPRDTTEFHRLVD